MKGCIFIEWGCGLGEGDVVHGNGRVGKVIAKVMGCGLRKIMRGKNPFTNTRLTPLLTPSE